MGELGSGCRVSGVDEIGRWGDGGIEKDKGVRFRMSGVRCQEGKEMECWSKDLGVRCQE